MRKYVIAHPKYADMEEWRGSETSDITYSDVQSTLTKLLMEKGYLARENWEGKLPEYFIEVKTTTGSCETPFYMSKAQYQRVSLPHHMGSANKTDLTIDRCRRPTVLLVILYMSSSVYIGLVRRIWVLLSMSTLRLLDKRDF